MNGFIKDRKFKAPIPLLLFAVAFVIAAAFVVWWIKGHIVQSVCDPLLETEQAQCAKRIEELQTESQPEQPNPAPTPAPEPKLAEAERRWVEIVGAPPDWPKAFPLIEDCQGAQTFLLSICRELGMRPYLQGRIAGDEAFELLVKIGEILADRPPVASGELLRFESTLANVFHFFRVIGRKRLDLLREILSQETDMVEPMALAMYEFMISRESCEGAASKIRFTKLYDYSSYFLNTIGGQGYLSRRSPKIAGLVMFYSLVILDQAMDKGINPHGVDPRPHIDRCRELLSRPDLIFKDRYMEMLQEMEARWSRL